MTYDCMTADELALWQEAADHYYLRGNRGAKTPCADCPLAFRAEAIAAGVCRRARVQSEAEVQRRRDYAREWKRASRARGRAA